MISRPEANKTTKKVGKKKKNPVATHLTAGELDRMKETAKQPQGQQQQPQSTAAATKKAPPKKTSQRNKESEVVAQEAKEATKPIPARVSPDPQLARFFLFRKCVGFALT
jgi:hypothetical protein